MSDFDFESEEFKKYAKETAKSIALPIMYFRAVLARLDQTINKVNEELRKQNDEAGEAQKQIVRLTFGLGKRIELGYGQTRTCTIALTADHSHIEALITNKPDFPGSPTEHLRAFLLECDASDDKWRGSKGMDFPKFAETAVRAYKVDLEPQPYAVHEVKAEEIAESIAAGMVRGHFD
jgi:hypothetical protein